MGPVSARFSLSERQTLARSTFLSRIATRFRHNACDTQPLLSEPPFVIPSGCAVPFFRTRPFARERLSRFAGGDLRRYQDVFGEEFGVKELLMLEDIRVKAMIAGALADMPEFLIDQIGKASNSSNFPSMTRAMERIADVVEEKWEEERE